MLLPSLGQCIEHSPHLPIIGDRSDDTSVGHQNIPLESSSVHFVWVLFLCTKGKMQTLSGCGFVVVEERGWVRHSKVYHNKNIFIKEYYC